MKKETQNRLVAWTIWIMQWLLMAAACAAFYIFYAESGAINFFCGVFFLVFSYKAQRLRILFFKQYTGMEKHTQFFKWLSSQNRSTRRRYGREFAKIARKSGAKQR